MQIPTQIYHVDFWHGTVYTSGVVPSSNRMPTHNRQSVSLVCWAWHLAFQLRKHVWCETGGNLAIVKQ